MKLYSYILSLLILSSTCFAQNNDHWITVFIHGSFSLRPHLSLKNALRMLYDTIEESIYYRATELSRRDPFFYKNQTMQELGLRKINMQRPDRNLAARIFARIYDDVSCSAGNTPSHEYYTFGWSGLVSHKLRYIEAGLLHKKLRDKVNALKKQGKNPKLRLICYSHGGNLALQLGAVHVTQPVSEQFDIDELWLFGTPVQIETDYLINSPIFKKVYNVYSNSDHIQTLDFFSFKRFFSRRTFSNRGNFVIPDKLTQIKLQFVDYEPRVEAGEFIGQYPAKRKELRKKFKNKKFAPGHFELWFMGWTILTFRPDFPTHPLPVVTFVPWIKKALDANPDLSNNVFLQIEPYNNTMLLYDHRRNRRPIHGRTHPFMPLKKLEQLKEKALDQKPYDYTLDIYNRKTEEALRIARKEHDEIKKMYYKEKNKNRKLRKRKRQAQKKKTKPVRMKKKKKDIVYIHEK